MSRLRIRLRTLPLGLLVFLVACTVNPAGRTPMSFPRSVGQIPVYYDQLPTGRPQKSRQRYESIYMDEANEALYPFGFGLSYSRFAYANPRVTNAKVPFNGATEVAVDVTNQGERDGQEVVQLYIRQPVAERAQQPGRLRLGGDDHDCSHRRGLQGGGGRVQRERERELASHQGVRRSEPGLGDREPLDRHHQAPVRLLG